MASNTYVNKVTVNNVTIIDLTEDTVTADTLMQGYTAHDKSGALITGTNTGGTMVIRDTEDSHGGTVRTITAGSVVAGTRTISANGTYDVAQYADASVEVPAAELQAKTATPSESQQVVQPDSGYDGLSQVTVGAISSSYVGSGITRRSSTNLTVSGATVTAPAGYYESSASKSVASGSATVNSSITTTPTVSVNSSGLVTASLNGSVGAMPSVTAGYIASGTSGTINYSGSKTLQLDTQAAKTVTPSTSQQTAVAAGKYTTGAVTVAAMPSGTAGTPTAAKGSVSNHSISITPSVTNTTGYITGGTKTGTAVNVSASELVSGTLEVTENGTADVTNYASVDVSVSGGATNIVIGTFSSSSAATQTIDIPYSGNGYPVLIDVHVTNVETNSNWQNLVSRYKVEHITLSKLNPDTAPTYSGDNNDVMIGVVRYKNSTSDSTVYDTAQRNATTFSTQSPSSSYATYFLKMYSTKVMKAMFGYTSYSFQTNLSYTYTIVYSE